MKRYNSGGHIIVTIGALIFGGIAGTIIATKASGVENIEKEIPGIVIFCVIFIGVPIIMSIVNLVYMKRKKIALQGHKGIGKVIKNYCTVEKNGRTCELEIEHQTDSGEHVILATSVLPDESSYFPVGSEIPLYINGKYAYFKKEEIINQNINNNKTNNSKNDIIICPYCGTEINNSKKCPNCRSNIE